MCDHAADVVADNTGALAGAETAVDEVGQGCSHGRLGEGRGVWTRPSARAPAVRSHDAAARARRWDEDVAELVRVVREAVDQKEGAPL